MAVVTMRQLLESGVHFGHQTRRWNPKMKRFIMTERNGIYIIDLQQSLTYINNAFEFVKETVAHGGTILFVGTKKQAQEPIAEQATRVGMPYVNHRWLGGMLTNFSTISKRLTRLKELEEINFDDVASSGHTKKELLILKREKDKLERTLGGIRDMAKVPSAVWVVDTKKEHLAVDEARKLGLPVIAILDTNCDPDEVDYKIPGNDDAIRSVTLLTRVIADAVAEGLIARAGGGARAEGTEGAEIAGDEPLAEWERELLQGDAAPAGAVAPAGSVAPAGGAASEPPQAAGSGAAPAPPVAPEAAPAEAAASEAVPVEAAALGITPAGTTPAEAGPAEAGTSETTPAGTTPAQAAPAEAGPAEAGTSESTPAEVDPDTSTAAEAGAAAATIGAAQDTEANA
jgi:small subunit ribosomal protein S2